MEFVSTPDKIKLGFFTDGSFARSSEHSGFAIVFRRFRPPGPPGTGTCPEDGKRVEMGYQIPPLGYLDSMLVEGLAILQTLRVATAELQAIGPAAALETNEVSVRILSDCNMFLQGLRGGVISQEPDTHHVAHW